jgi:DNA repair protein RecN (Recombination protein N)
MVHLGEAARGLRDYRGRIEFDPQRLETIERGCTRSSVEAKYGAAWQTSGALGRRAAGLGRWNNRRRACKTLEARAGDSGGDLLRRASALSAARRRAAQALQQAVLAELSELGMAKAAFEVRVTTAAGDEAALGPHGLEAIEFLISPNPGSAEASLRSPRAETVTG